MGTMVEYRKLPGKEEVFRLLIYCNDISGMNTDAVSLNKPLAEELIKLKPFQRTMQFEKCFVNVLKALPDRPMIKDIDVMFNPAYKIDVLKVLVSAYKQKPYSLVWPGIYSDGKLIYSEEGYPDYRVYEIQAYDIMCVI